MKTFKNLALLVILLNLAACNKDAMEDDMITTNPPTPTGSFEEVIEVGEEFPEFPEFRTEKVIETSEPANEDYTSNENGNTVTQRYICTSKTLDVLDGNGSFPLFNTTADVIYPGNLLQGKTLSNTTPSPIVVERAGGTVSYNLNNGNTSSSFTVDEVKKSSIQDAMNNIISNSGDVVPANFQMDIIQIESESQLALELGINAETYSAQVSADLSFSSEMSFNRTLVKLNQSYYTMSFDLPTSLEEVFAPSVSPEQLATYVQADNPATFISSVTYGRIFYMLIESTSSREEMDAKINFAYGAFKNSVDGELEVSALEELESLKIKVIAYGGDAKGAFEVAGETNVSDIASKLAENTDIRAGLPLSYVVRSVERPDKIVGTSLATQYEVVECELKGTLAPGGLTSITDIFSDDEDGGGIGAMAQVHDSNVLMFNTKGDRYAWYNGNTGEVKGIFNIKEENSPLGVMPFDAVDSAIREGSKTIYFFDDSGFLMSRFEFTPANWGGNGPAPTSPIGLFLDDSDNLLVVNQTYGDSGNFQFSSTGFGAATRVGINSYAYFTKSGDRYAIYTSLNGGSWANPKNSTTWFDGIDNVGGRTIFENVGAATAISFGGSSGKWYLINDVGDEIIEYIVDANNNRIVNGPWVIN